MGETARRGDPRYPFTAWNFIVIVLDASFFFAGLAFVDPIAVLPVLIERLGGSQMAVGLMGAIIRAGWIIPQLLATSFVLHRSRRKPFVMGPVIIGRLPFIGLTIAFILPAAASRPALLLPLLLSVFAAFFFLDGLVGVPWNDIIARTIPPNLRGRFFGAMQFLSGLLAAAAAEVVRRVLANSSIPFPRNYGLLFILLSACMTISTLFLAFIKEPEGAALSERQSLARIIRATPSTLRRYPLLLRVIIAQNVLGIGGLAFPFYAVYAHTRLNLPAASGGIFIWAGVAGAITASLIWAYLNDHHGPLPVIRGVAAVGLTAPLAAVLMPMLVRAIGAQESMVYFYAVTFLLNGAVGGGMWMGFTNYVLEIAPEHIRPLFLGLAATLAAPTVVMPLLGGWLLGVLSYEALFAIAGGCAVLAFLYVLRLERPHQLALDHDR